MSANDYLYLKNINKRYYNLFKIEKNISLDLTDTQMERFGFYFYVLKMITGEDDFDTLCEMIIDTDFNSTLFNNRFDDKGVDAVYIDNDNFEIKLFNFKYREKFVENYSQKDNELRISSKFINAFLMNDYSSLCGKTKTFCEIIGRLLNSTQQRKIKLYYVSNEAKPLSESGTLKEFYDFYGVEVICISLYELSILSDKKHNIINANLGIPIKDYILFQEKQNDANKSFVVNIPIAELLRITCTSDMYRKQLSVNDISELKKYKLDVDVLYENVRGYLGKTKYNGSIISTLIEEPTKFFLYNNGITMTVSKINYKKYNSNKNIQLELSNMQVVNGGQTLKVLSDFANFNNELNSLIIGRILVKIYMVGNYEKSCDNKLGNKIAKYTNSQNVIKGIDLKSLDDIQFQIEKILDDNNILYIRKRGKLSNINDKEYDHQISFEKFGQILWSIQGSPHRAANQKSKIFDDYYDEIFKSNKFKYEKVTDYVETYFEIKKSVNSKIVDEQMVFYILYIAYEYNFRDYVKTLDFINQKLNTYKSKTDAPKRPLITSNFKTYIDEHIDELVNANI